MKQSNIHGKTGGGNVFFNEPWKHLYKMAKENDLSKEAQKRLKWMEYYDECKNASLTCRYFGISRQTFHKWKKRFDPARLSSLEEVSKRPKKVRQPETPRKELLRIISLRKQYPYWGKEKLKALLEQEGIFVSSSTIGRIIKRYNLFFKKEKRYRRNTRAQKKKRITEMPQNNVPGHHIQLDTIVLHRNGKKYYVKTVEDVTTKISYARVYKGNSSETACDVLERFAFVVGYKINNVHTDNGSEFHKHFKAKVKQKKAEQYFSYPRCPKQHGAIERFNRTFKDEFLRWGNFNPSIEKFNALIAEWLIEYNFIRPHQSLKYKTPIAFYINNFLSSSSPTNVSAMYWTRTLH